MSVLCLVPTPLRAGRSARRLCDAQGGLLFGTRVMVPEALAPALLAAAGDRRPLLTPLAERILAAEAGREAGGPFAGLEPQHGLAAALASTVAELRRGEITAAQIRAAIPETGGGAAERLGHLAAVLEIYQGRLEALGALDRPAAVRAAVEALTAGARAEEQNLDLLVLDGFTALPPATFDLVASLAHRARRTRARLPFFPERPDLCGPAEPLLRKLEGLHELAARRDVSLALETLEGEGRAEGAAAALAAVAGGPGRPTGASADGEAGAVIGCAGAGEEGEAEAAARLIARLLERGFAPEEILVFAASPARVAPRLARACAGLGVPFASGRGLALSDLGPAQAVRQALEAALRPGRAALEAVALSPYLGLGRPPERLGFWLDRAGAWEGRGDPEAALRSRAALLRSPMAAAERAALLRSAEALAAVRDALRPLAASGLPREHAARLRAFLLHAGARRRAARNADAPLARRDLAALARVEEVADDLVRSLALLGRGAAPLAGAAWAQLLELALDGAAGPAEPEPAAGAVELWPISEAPGLTARAALVMGCERGRFPAPPPPEPLLRDAERVALQRVAGRSAIASTSRRRAEAQHEAFCALAAGREVIGLTWRGAGPEGAGAAPAPLAVEALLAAGAEVPAAPERAPDLAAARSSAEVLRAVAAAGPEAAAALAAAPALAGRAASALARGALEQERREVLLAGGASPAAGALPAELLPALQGALPEEWSPSQLEQHATCAYRFFAGQVLGLAEPTSAEVDIDPRDEGSLAHAVLERFLRRRLQRGALPLRGGPDEKIELGAAAVELFARFEADGRTGDPAAWAGRSAAVLGRLERVVAAEAEEPGDAIPALLEYKFGGSSGVPPLVLSDPEHPGDEVRLRGRLDRVDASADRLVLLDYKDTKANAEWKKKLEPGAFGDTNFQVPAYLLAAARALPGRPRLEASYVFLRSAERLEPFTAEDDGSPDAPFQAEFAKAVVSKVRTIRSGLLPIASRDCSHCPFGAVCRFQTLAEAAP